MTFSWVAKIGNQSTAGMKTWEVTKGGRLQVATWPVFKWLQTSTKKHYERSPVHDLKKVEEPVKYILLLFKPVIVPIHGKMKSVHLKSSLREKANHTVVVTGHLTWTGTMIWQSHLPRGRLENTTYPSLIWLKSNALCVPSFQLGKAIDVGKLRLTVSPCLSTIQTNWCDIHEHTSQHVTISRQGEKNCSSRESSFTLSGMRNVISR